jgi:hypothetical protein
MQPPQSPILQPPSWTATRRGRAELLAVVLFGVAAVGVPLCRTELYPFSRAPMFADAPRVYCSWAVLDPAGRSLPLDEFGLQRNYWGNPLGVGVGFAPLPSVDRFGSVPSREEVSEAVRKHLARRKDIAYVEIIQEVIGPVGSSVGRTQTTSWRINNPGFSESGTK